MSRQSLSIYMVLLMVTTTLLTTIESSAASLPCLTATPLALNSTLRQTGNLTSETFIVSLTQPGVLALEISTVVHSSQNPPGIAIATNGCSTLGSTQTAVLYQTPDELVLKIDAVGMFYFTVTASTQNANSIPYKLRTTFVSDPQGPPDLIQPASEPPSTCSLVQDPTVDMILGTQTAQVEDDTSPWDCDILSGNFPSGILVLGSEGTALEASVYADDGCLHRVAEGILFGDTSSIVATPVLEGEHRLMIGPVDASGAYRLHFDHFPICAFGEQDDHSDSRLCASSLQMDQTIAGLLDGFHGDDEDVFYFRLDQQETIELDLQAGSGISCLLYDDRGQRLTSWQDCDLTPLQRTLGAGFYRVKVTGANQWNQPYSLTLRHPGS